MYQSLNFSVIIMITCMGWGRVGGKFVSGCFGIF